MTDEIEVNEALNITTLDEIEEFLKFSELFPGVK
jgi:hypothetical protein